MSYSSYLLSVLLVVLSVIFLIEACWDVMKGWSEERRESRALLFVLPDRAPVSWDEQMVDLAGTWAAQAHPQEGTNATALPSLIPPLPWIPPSHSLSLSAHSAHPQRCVNQHNLSSPLSMQGRQQHGSSAQPGSRGVDEVHNQGKEHFILPLWTPDLM